MLQFTTKAETLRSLEGRLAAARVLPQVCLTAAQAREDPGLAWVLLGRAGMAEGELIVRSSAQNEDTAQCSNAGKFLSIPNVRGEAAVREAVYGVMPAWDPAARNSACRERG